MIVITRFLHQIHCSPHERIGEHAEAVFITEHHKYPEDAHDYKVIIHRRTL